MKLFITKHIVSNIDYYKTQLILNRKFNKKSLKLSTSAIVFYWGVKLKSSNLGLHNIIFPEDYKNEFSQIFDQNSIPVILQYILISLQKLIKITHL